MKLSRTAKTTLAIIMAFGFTFIYLPLVLVVINSFNTNKSFAWPPTGFTTEWWSKAAVNEGIRDAV
ncbi:MAG: ABC transporter permease, partial [Actinobacteria bacterium]|nr:ABC transporter permease [Actinomycetota bacterium]